MVMGRVVGGFYVVEFRPFSACLAYLLVTPGDARGDIFRPFNAAGFRFSAQQCAFCDPNLASCIWAMSLQNA